MARPAYRAGSYLTGAGSGVTTITPTLPTGWAAGDLVVLTLAQGTVAATLPATPSGWTVFPRTERTGTGPNLQAWWRIMQAGDTAPALSWTTSSSVRWQSAAFTAPDTVAPVNVANGSNNASSATVTCPGVTPTDASTLLLWQSATSIGRTFTIPAGMTSIGSDAGAGLISTAMAMEDYTGTSATGNRNGSVPAATANTAELAALAGPAPSTSQAIVIG